MALASCTGVFINILRLPLKVEGAAILMREANKFGPKSVTLSIIEPTAAAAPSAEVREQMAILAKNKIVAAAITLEGSGFGPAAIRTLIAGMYLVTKKEYPHKIFDQASAAVAWLVPLLEQAGVSQKAAAILATADAARASIK